MIDILADIYVKIVLMIALGLALKKFGVLTEELKKGLSSLLLTAVLPASILASANQPLEEGAGIRLLSCAGFCCMAFLVAYVLGRLVSAAAKLPADKKGLFVTMTLLPNSAFIGMPLVKALYGGEGMLYAVVFSLFWHVCAFTLGTGALSGQKKIDLRQLLRDPATVCSVAALALYVSPLRMPVSVASALDSIGSMCLPLSLMIVGAGLADVRLPDILKAKDSYLVSALRLAVAPGIMLTAMLLLKAGPVLTCTCTVLSGLPAGSLNAVFAEKYGASKAFAVTGIVQSTVLMLISLPLLLLALERLVK